MAFPENSVCLLKPALSLAFIFYFPGLKTALEYQIAFPKMDQYQPPSLPGCFGGGATTLTVLLQQPDFKE